MDLILILIMIVVGIWISHKQEKERQEKIIRNNLGYDLQLYNQFLGMGMTEKDMCDKFVMMKYTIEKLRARGMIK